MTAIIARLDPCVNWMKLLSRTHGRILWLFPMLLVAVYMWSVDWGNVLGAMSERRSVHAVNASLRTQARGLGLKFDEVVANPQATIGKPVTWCVSSNDGKSGFVEEKATMPIVWTSPSEELRTMSGAYGYCFKMLAIVEGLDRGAVMLRPIEKL